MSSPAAFYNFFHDSSENYPIAFNFTFTRVGSNVRTYAYLFLNFSLVCYKIDWPRYDNDYFFPIDGRGWGDQGYSKY